MKKTSTIFILRGVPGSGKTTLSKELEKTGLFTRISSDDLGLKAWKEPFVEAIERGEEYIVLDRCNTSIKQRESVTELLKPYSEKITTVLISLPKKTYKELESRIKKDIGHKYGVEQRIVALKNHLNDIKKDKVNMKKEGWDFHIIWDLNPNKLITDILKEIL